MDNSKVRTRIPVSRKGIYYVGMGLVGIGLLLFLSTFVSFCAHFGDFSDFEARARNEMGRAIAGVCLIVVGGGLSRLGQRGLAGSGAVLDPERARTDLEPWSRMAGGMVKDALGEAGLDKPAGAPVVKVRCPVCKALNDETEKFCGQCGKPLA